MKKCVSCNAFFDDAAKFCDFCGNELVEEVKEKAATEVLSNETAPAETEESVPVAKATPEAAPTFSAPDFTPVAKKKFNFKSILFAAIPVVLIISIVLNIISIIYNQRMYNMETKSNEMYVVITDYVQPNSGEDVSDVLQEVILSNPNKTIYFPDGEYLLSKPICTPANPVNAVSLKLATFAKLKAMDSWTENEAVVRIGAAEPYNTIDIPGSNYYFEGGIIDGNGKANGISIDSGRETAIHHVSIKNTRIGLHIKRGANNGSSDSDILNVNIVGNHSKTSVGVLLEGSDNTLTNMRIAGVHVGVQVNSGGNIFRNIHPLYIFRGDNAEDENYLTSTAFKDTSDNNFYDICYSDQFCTAFSMQSQSRNIYTNSFIMWYASRGGVEIAFKADGKFNSVVKTPRVNFLNNTENTLLLVTQKGGSGIIENPLIYNEDYISDKTYQEYLVGDVITPNK